MLRSYLFEAAGVLLTRVPKWSALKAWGVMLAKRKGSERPQSPSRASSRSFLHRMWIDRTEFDWSTKKAAAYAHKEITSSRDTAGNDVSAGTVGGGEIARFFCELSIRETALATLIHQRRLTPSCRGHAPTAERTVGPARIIAESFIPKPGIREHNLPTADSSRRGHSDRATTRSGALSVCFLIPSRTRSI
jgi:hypothetical protein